LRGTEEVKVQPIGPRFFWNIGNGIYPKEPVHLNGDAEFLGYFPAERCLNDIVR
jgi:hypothetical protein